MSVSEKLLRAALVFCLFYTALAIRERTVGYEAFPFFAWDLYVKVPPDMTTSYSARILELDGRPIDSRPYYEEARRLVPAAKNVRAIQLLERLGRAVDTDRPESARRARKAISGRNPSGYAIAYMATCSAGRAFAIRVSPSELRSLAVRSLTRAGPQSIVLVSLLLVLSPLSTERAGAWERITDLPIVHALVSARSSPRLDRSD